MATLTSVKEQIRRNKSQLEIAQRQISQAKQQAIKSQETLRLKKRNLPKVTAQSLRAGRFEGLNGRTQRRKLSKEKEFISDELSRLGIFQKGLKKYEKEKLKPWESSIKSQEENISAYQIASKYIREGTTPWVSDSPEVKKAFNELAKEQGKSLSAIKGDILSRRQQISDINKSLKGTGKFLGAEGQVVDIATGKFMSIPEYNAQIQKLSPQTLDIPKSNVLIQDTTKKKFNLTNGFGNITGNIGGNITGQNILGDSYALNRTSDGNFLNRFVSSVKESFKAQAPKETFVKGLGFASTSAGVPEVSTSTLTIRSPTITELNKINQAEATGDFIGSAVLGVPAQYLGGYLTKSFTPEEKQRLSGFNVLNPKTQYDVFKSSYESKQAGREAQKINTQLENLNKQYNTGKIDYRTYATKFDYYSNLPAYKKATTEQRTTIFQDISKSNLTPSQKFGTSALVSGADFLTYLSAPVRLIRGGEAIYTGVEDLSGAKTKKEKIGAGASIGVGSLLVASGVGGGTSLFGKGNLFTGASSKAGKVGQGFIRNAPLGAISGYTGYSVFKQTEDPYTALGAGVGAFTAIKAPEILRNIPKTKLTKKEIKVLESDLNKLEKAEVVDSTLVRRGKGSRPNSDRVDIIVVQESNNFIRKIKVSGDLVKTESGNKFFPIGEGKATTQGKFEVNNKGKLFTNVQSFEVGSKIKGVNIGNVGDVRIGTLFGSETYIPKQSISLLIKEPKNILQATKENLLLKLKKPIKTEGGDIIKTVETDLTPRTLSLKRGGGEVGVIFSRGRKGTFIDIAEPKPSGVKVVRSNLPMDKKTPLSKTFGDSSILKVENTPAIPELRNIPQTAVKGSAETIKRELPSMVGGLGLKGTPKYTGLGIYETAEFQAITPTTRQPIQQQSRIDIIGELKSSMPLKIDTKVKTDLLIKPDIQTKTRADFLTRTKTDTKIKSDTQTKIRTKQPIKSLLDIRTQQKQRQITEQITKPKPPTEKINYLLPPILSKGKAGKKIKSKEGEELFEVFGKRFGKFSKVGEATSKFEAERIFRKFAKGGLGRSGFIEKKGGERLKFGELSLGSEFRPSKRDKKILVQKAKFSLGTGSERREIQMFRKKSKKKRKNSFF